jgi:hypothetical protein
VDKEEFEVLIRSPNVAPFVLNDRICIDVPRISMSPEFHVTKNRVHFPSYEACSNGSTKDSRILRKTRLLLLGTHGCSYSKLNHKTTLVLLLSILFIE